MDRSRTTDRALDHPIQRLTRPIPASAALGVPLAVTAASYVVWDHLGGVPGGFGPAGGGTRVADWIDLLTPYAVLLPALVTLLTTAPSRARLVCFALGSWLYADGHGIHLSANSVGNSPGYRDPPRTAHLWDEYVGHWIWYAGVAAVVMVLASTLPGRQRPRHPVAWLLAVLVGVTWSTNSVAGNMTWAGLAVAAAAGVWGVRHHRDQGALLAASGATSALLLGAWLIVQPPFSL